jgi:hypothetical protein
MPGTNESVEIVKDLIEICRERRRFPRLRRFYPEALITRPLSFMVFLFEQTAQASTCQTVRRFGVTQVRYHSKDRRT